MFKQILFFLSKRKQNWRELIESSSELILERNKIYFSKNINRKKCQLIVCACHN